MAYNQITGPNSSKLQHANTLKATTCNQRRSAARELPLFYHPHLSHSLTFTIRFFSPSAQTARFVIKFSIIGFFHYLRKWSDRFSLWLLVGWLVVNNTQLLLAVWWQPYRLLSRSIPAKVALVGPQDEVIWTKKLYVELIGLFEATKFLYTEGK